MRKTPVDFLPWQRTVYESVYSGFPCYFSVWKGNSCNIKKCNFCKSMKSLQIRPYCITNETYCTYIFFVSWRSIGDVSEILFLMEFELHTYLSVCIMLLDPQKIFLFQTSVRIQLHSSTAGSWLFLLTDEGQSRIWQHMTFLLQLQVPALTPHPQCLVLLHNWREAHEPSKYVRLALLLTFNYRTKPCCVTTPITFFMHKYVT